MTRRRNAPTDPRGSVASPQVDKRPPVKVTRVLFHNPRPLVTVYASNPTPKIPKGAIVRVIQDVDTTDANVRAIEKVAEHAGARVDVSPRPKHAVVAKTEDVGGAREVALRLAQQVAFQRGMPEIVTVVEEALAAAGL